MSNEFYDIKQTITCVEDMPPIARDIVKSYCDQWGFDEFNLTPNVWRDVLTELRVKLFVPCRYTMLKKGGDNSYDITCVEWVYNNIYKRLCDMHNKECSIHGFCNMSGVSKDELYAWSSGILSGQQTNLINDIRADNEDSLFGLLQQKSGSPVGFLAKLNKYHGWSMPGAHSGSDSKDAIAVSNLPTVEQLENAKQIQNSEITTSGIPTAADH